MEGAAVCLFSVESKISLCKRREGWYNRDVSIAERQGESLCGSIVCAPPSENFRVRPWN